MVKISKIYYNSVLDVGVDYQSSGDREELNKNYAEYSSNFDCSFFDIN